MGSINECGVRNLYLIFVQSRMASIDETTSKSIHLTQLPFEGFMEAIVRLSLLKLARWLSAREGPSTHSEAENDRPGWTRLCAVRVMSAADGEIWATHARTRP